MNGVLGAISVKKDGMRWLSKTKIEEGNWEFLSARILRPFSPTMVNWHALDMVEQSCLPRACAREELCKYLTINHILQRLSRGASYVSGTSFFGPLAWAPRDVEGQINQDEYCLPCRCRSNIQGWKRVTGHPVGINERGNSTQYLLFHWLYKLLG